MDISGNSLLDKVFIDEDNGTSIFGHLPNLTHLYLQDNRFTQVLRYELLLEMMECFKTYQNEKHAVEIFLAANWRSRQTCQFEAIGLKK